MELTGARNDTSNTFKRRTLLTIPSIYIKINEEVGKNNETFMYNNQTTVTCQNEFTIKLNFIDILLFNKTLRQQLSELKPRQKQVDVEKFQTTKLVLFDVKGLTFMVINQEHHLNIPVIKLKLFHNDSKLVLCSHKIVLEIKLLCEIHFFNHYTFHWEPLIEQLNWNVILENNQNSSLKNYVNADLKMTSVNFSP